jgi:hypothetical protein
MLSEEEILESLKAHVGRNREQLQAIHGRGESIDKPRPVRHHFWAAAQMDAAHLARELHRLDYLIMVLQPHDIDDGGRFWNVEAEMVSAPERAASRTVTEALIRLAAHHDALYDGWAIEV